MSERLGPPWPAFTRFGRELPGIAPNSPERMAVDMACLAGCLRVNWPWMTGLGRHLRKRRPKPGEVS